MKANALLATVVVLGSAVGLSACSTSAASTGEPSAKVATATVEQRDLVMTTSSSGSLQFAESHPIATALDGTITSLPREGQTIENGGTLYSIDTRPIVRLNGNLPAWRDLTSSSSDGEDITQLEQGLKDLGYGTGLTVDDDWTSATTAAVKKWQKALGVKQTGSFTLGQLEFTPSDVRIDSLSARVGDAVTPGTAIENIGPTRKVVTSNLASNISVSVAKGDTVSVLLGDGSTIEGKVTSVISNTGPDGSVSRDVTVGFKTPPPDTTSSDTAVRATFTNVIATDALVVPVSALVALSGGGYGVEKVAANGTKSYVAVTPGKFANTDVAIVSADLKAGDTVVVTP